MQIFTRWPNSNRHWRLLLLTFPPLFLLVFLSLSSSATVTFNRFAAFAPLKLFSFNHTNTYTDSENYRLLINSTGPSVNIRNATEWVENMLRRQRRRKKEELNRAKIAVCLVGGARRFELTGPSLIDKVLKVYPNTDTFLHSPLDRDSYKFSSLKVVDRVVSVRIFEPKPIPETGSELRVLTADNSPNGIQGLLQYFNLVEGCLTMIKTYQTQKNFTYDWIVRTRVDGYWSEPLDPEFFIPGFYLIPPGSSYGGLNDRLGIGDLKSSTIALSRLSLIPKLESVGFTKLNSETSFKAQLTTLGVPYTTRRLPFCIVSDRKYLFPPNRYGVPVASMSSPGPLSGAKCRPCTPVCQGPCVADVMLVLNKGWSWTDWGNGTLQLCDAHAEWENGWEEVFDRVAGKKLARERKRVLALTLEECVKDFEEMQNRTVNWDAPPAKEICRLHFGDQR